MLPNGVLAELRARLIRAEAHAESAAEEGLHLEAPVAFIRDTLALAERLHEQENPHPTEVYALAKALAKIRGCGWGSP